MKKTYQAPIIEISALEPMQMIAATVTDIIGTSGNTTIIHYGGGGSGPARAGGNNLWDDESSDSGWDEL